MESNFNKFGLFPLDGGWVGGGGGGGLLLLPQFGGKGLALLFQVKYYSGEDFEVERLDDAIKDYQV